MLDQSVPYFDIMMYRPAGPVESPHLPPAYTFRYYQPGDEHHWARIETSVKEFSREDQALNYFRREFMPQADLLTQRMVFVLDPQGVPVATATAWSEALEGVCWPQLHWVAVQPHHQGKGLGRAVVMETMGILHQIYPSQGMMLHTQTWSHTAVRLYLHLGFRPLRQGKIGRRKSHFPEACAVLRRVFDPATFRIFSEEGI